MYICRYFGCMSVLATQLQQCHCRTDRCSQYAVYSMLHTVTCPSVSTVSCVAFTSDRPKCVGAGSVWVTRRLNNTLIDICRQRIVKKITRQKCIKLYCFSSTNWHLFNQAALCVCICCILMQWGLICAPTIAQQSVASVPRVASTCEGPECVGAGSVSMTRRLSHTFIDICRWMMCTIYCK